MPEVTQPVGDRAGTRPSVTAPASLGYWVSGTPGQMQWLPCEVSEWPHRCCQGRKRGAGIAGMGPSDGLRSLRLAWPSRGGAEPLLLVQCSGGAIPGTEGLLVCGALAHLPLPAGRTTAYGSSQGSPATEPQRTSMGLTQGTPGPGPGLWPPCPTLEEAEGRGEDPAVFC